MSNLGLSSQILQNMWRYTGKPICVTSFSGIPHAALPCCAGKTQPVRGKPYQWKQALIVLIQFLS